MANKRKTKAQLIEELEQLSKRNAQLEALGIKRREIEQELKKTNWFLDSIVENIPNMIFVKDAINLRFERINLASELLTGYQRKDLLGKSDYDFFPYEQAHFFTSKDKEVLEGKKLVDIAEEPIQTKQGLRILHTKKIPILDENGTPQFLLGISEDITARKQAEAELILAHEELEKRVKLRTMELSQANQTLQEQIFERQQAEEQLKASREQLRNLLARVQTVREEERTHISRELHDELGQALTALNLDITWLQNNLSANKQTLLNKTIMMSKLIDTIIQSIQKMAADLRPSVLDNLGLIAAIEWQMQAFQSRTGIKCRLKRPNTPLSLETEQTTAIFRIFQEAMTNIARHAKASQVAICLQQKDDSIYLEVKDNGKGINNTQLSDTKSLGLLGIHERALNLGGNATITSNGIKGTKVQVQIPLHKPLKVKS